KTSKKSFPLTVDIFFLNKLKASLIPIIKLVEEEQRFAVSMISSVLNPGCIQDNQYLKSTYILV
ncbi:unnamed protein product, partial [Candidula unifasciata]